MSWPVNFLHALLLMSILLTTMCFSVQALSLYSPYPYTLSSEDGLTTLQVKKDEQNKWTATMTHHSLPDNQVILLWSQKDWYIAPGQIRLLNNGRFVRYFNIVSCSGRAEFEDEFGREPTQGEEKAFFESCTAPPKETVLEFWGFEPINQQFPGRAKLLKSYEIKDVLTDLKGIKLNFDYGDMDFSWIKVMRQEYEQLIIKTTENKCLYFDSYGSLKKTSNTVDCFSDSYER